MTQDFTYRGRQTYQKLFDHLGKIEIKNGHKIITNNIRDKNSGWQAICYGAGYGEIYVCERATEGNIDDVTGWFKSWTGKKYLNFQLHYEGEFQHFMKHTGKQKGKQYLQSKVGLETFIGGFKYNKRHTDRGNTDAMIVKNAESIIERLEGAWENGNKQGRFTVGVVPKEKQNTKTPHPKFRVVDQQSIKCKYFYNDVEVQPSTEPKKAQRQTIQLTDKFCLGITPEGVRSLDTGLCLYTEIVDLFFKHLNASFDKYADKYYNMKAFTVFMFEKLVPSGKVSSQRKGKVQINYSNLKNLGAVYNGISSIFEVNPLILMPLNRDQSHFALGAIQSEVTRQNIANNVKFKILYLDPLHNTQECVPEIIRQFIRKEIDQHIPEKEGKKYYISGLEKAEVDFKQIKFTKQNNEVDCGVFTCLYGLLLTIEVCLKDRYTINWRWDQQSVDLIKWLRLEIKADAYHGIHNFFPRLLDKLEKTNVIRPRKDEQPALKA